jgi:hypothetical protein
MDRSEREHRACRWVLVVVAVAASALATLGLVQSTDQRDPVGAAL